MSSDCNHDAHHQTIFVRISEEDEDIFEDGADHSDGKIAHISESDHNTDTEGHDTDADPNFIPASPSDSDFNSDIIQPTDDKEPVAPQEEIQARRSVSSIQPTVSHSTSGNNMDIDETVPVVDNSDNLYKIIEDVVRGSGHIENIFFGRD